MLLLSIFIPIDVMNGAATPHRDQILLIGTFLDRDLRQSGFLIQLTGTIVLQDFALDGILQVSRNCTLRAARHFHLEDKYFVVTKTFYGTSVFKNVFFQ